MRFLFAATIFVGSALLFLVQPMVAKMLLPAYGGTPAVWNTSMVFFQAALVVGYGYAHLSFRWLGPKGQPLVHLGLLAGAFLLLPVAFGPPPASLNPSLSLLAQLTVGVGLPFVAVSAGAPMLQRWYAATGSADGKDPYFLYASSNLASILALLAYPIVFEPLMRLGIQSQSWRFGYIGLLVLVAACAAVLLKSGSTVQEESTAAAPEAEAPTRKTILYWIALSFVPSSLLLGVTTYLTTNLASAPLLWVIPLALYLLTFVVAFSRRRLFESSFYGRLAAMLMAPMVLVIVLQATDPILALGALHLLVFVLGALTCHTRLYEIRPDASHLTAFYFWISVGGVLGGIFNALLAPMVFHSLAEYPIALVALMLLVPAAKPGRPNWADFALPAAIGVFTVAAVLICDALKMEPSPARTGITLGVPALASFLFAERPVRYGLSLGAIFLAASLFGIGATGELLRTERSFFGVHRVLLTEEGKFRELMHGNTIHGRQSTDPSRRGEPLTYYYRTGPIGQVFETLGASFQRVGLVGMGVGSLAAYGRPGQSFTFFEIDPDVVDIARDSGLFTFIPDSQAKVDVVLGDARLSLATAREGLDLLVLDAFSSDAIPTHLLTLEAIRMYRTKLSPNGIMAFHTSNRYLELNPILAAAARDLGMAAMFQEDVNADEGEKELGKFPSTWVLLAMRPEALDPLRKDIRWEELTAKPDRQAWTDDYSNLIEAFLEKSRKRE